MIKGALTHQRIIDMGRRIFNEKGINLTLENLSKEMGIPKGRVTNHFPTKDQLFLAILMEYEKQLQQIFVELNLQGKPNTFYSLVVTLNKVMDLQYEFRCSIIYLNVISPGQADLRKHVQERYSINVQSVHRRLSDMVHQGLLKSEIISPDSFPLFLFVYVNQLTQWVIYHDMYEQQKSYKSMKPHYIRSILIHTYHPYLTLKGKRQLEALNLLELVD